MNLPSKSQEPEEQTLWEQLKQDCISELELAQRELKEIIMLIEQSQLETSRLQQRNASISAHLQQILAQIESVSKDEIRMTYEAALDAQQRLFVMRGQIDKLQSDHSHIDHYQKIIERVNQALETEELNSNGSKKEQSSLAKTVEMIIQAQEAERGRLARQMHDGPAQALSNFILQAEIAMRLFDTDQEKAREELKNLKGAASSSFGHVRDFIFDLRASMLRRLRPRRRWISMLPRCGRVSRTMGGASTRRARSSGSRRDAA